jgi:hypothetical protein
MSSSTATSISTPGGFHTLNDMSIFDKLFGKPKPNQVPAEPAPLSASVSEKHSLYPPTMGPPPSAEEKIQDFIFDPSTMHYTRAFRRGDPQLPAEEQRRWVSARREVMNHLVNIATSGPWVDYLVLRGSLALKSCLGKEAREPGDIDWVIQPSELRMDHPEAKQMLNSIIRDVTESPHCCDALIEHQDITRTDIWAYDRAPGHRIAFPWRCGDLPPAIVQMDFVFNQSLRLPAFTGEIRFEEGSSTGTRVGMASLEESLAWKLLWLINDTHPQGKDLYDAVLLAEQSTLSPQVLKSVLESEGCWRAGKILSEFPFANLDCDNVDWENFLKECPWVQGDIRYWHGRLLTALKPTVDQLKNEE